MLPMPATKRWSMSSVLSGAGRSARSNPKRSQLMTSSSGSKPRWASSGTCAVSWSAAVTNISPKVLGSTNRSWPPWVKVITTWVCLSSGSLTPLARSSWPLMPRWTTSTSSPSSPNRRYLPARRMELTRRPSSFPRNSGPLLWRRIDRLPFTSTVFTRRPTTSRSRSRRMVSTSGSSGTAAHLPAQPTAPPDSAVPGQGPPSNPGGGLLGVLLRPSLAGSLHAAAHEDPGGVAPSMVGTGPFDLVAGQLTHVPQHELLQPGLEVLGPGPRGGIDDARPQQAEDEAVRLFPAAVEVDRPDHRLDGVGQDRRLLASSRRVFASAQQQDRAEFEIAGDVGEHARVDDRGPHLGETALGHLRIGVVRVFRDDEAEDGVAREFQPFVGGQAAGLRTPRAVRERSSEQPRLPERHAEATGHGHHVHVRQRARRPGPGRSVRPCGLDHLRGGGARFAARPAAQTRPRVRRFSQPPTWRPRNRPRHGPCGGLRGPRLRSGSPPSARRGPLRALRRAR